MTITPLNLLPVVCASLISAANAAEQETPKHRLGVSHHGGVILHCSPPLFFDEDPARDAKIGVFQEFSFTASDNTEPDTVQVWVNNQRIPVVITEQRSGRLRVRGTLEAPISSGKVWIKVTGYSKDGCDQLHVWHVYPGT